MSQFSLRNLSSFLLYRIEDTAEPKQVAWRLNLKRIIQTLIGVTIQVQDQRVEATRGHKPKDVREIWSEPKFLTIFSSLLIFWACLSKLMSSVGEGGMKMGLVGL